MARGDVASKPDYVLGLLWSSAKDIGTLGYDRCYGCGRVDAYRAAKNQQSVDRRDASAPACGRA